MSNMMECKTCGVYLMGLTIFGHYTIEDTADFVTYIPNVNFHFVESLAVIPL
jgi:glucosamine--fructose-6-phosphate aminotransferase (isomerizing)